MTTYCELLLSVSVMMNVHKCTVSFKHYLRDLFMEPPGVPNLPNFRLVDIYAKCTEGNVKEVSFCNSSGKLQIVIGTTGFEMGLDCPNVRQIIFWGPLSVVYIQQTGWGGRDWLLSCALSTTQMLAIDGHQSK